MMVLAVQAGLEIPYRNLSGAGHKPRLLRKSLYADLYLCFSGALGYRECLIMVCEPGT